MISQMSSVPFQNTDSTFVDQYFFMVNLYFNLLKAKHHAILQFSSPFAKEHTLINAFTNRQKSYIL